jgi:hypothetical protein
MGNSTPLDLSALYNVGRANVPELPDGQVPWHRCLEEALGAMPAGNQSFLGVPFLLGEAQSKCWLMLGAGLAAQAVIALPEASRACYVLYAHFCNASFDPGDEKTVNGHLIPVLRPGERLAEYTLVYADGSEHSRPIRRRFEINEPGIAYGHLAFASRPHLKDSPRDPLGHHERGQWGENQTGVTLGAYVSRQNYWIYAMPNPHPGRTLKALRLEATGADTLAIAAITLYHGQHNPLRYQPRQTLRVTLPDDDASLTSQLPLDVDLGVIAQSYAPVPFHPEAWLKEQMRGWGEEPENSEPRVLVDIIASPEATLRVGAHEVAMGDVYSQGVAESTDRQARVELLTPRKTWVHVNVVDEATGSLTPARVHFRSPDGRYFPPYGHRHEVNNNWFEDYGGDLKLGSTPYAYVDGRFLIELPVGDCYAELSRGFEYEPERNKLVIEPGQRELTLRLRRRFDLRQAGWVTADTHVHFLSPQTAWLEAQAEGINLVNLLASQWGDLFTNVGDLTGDASGVSREGTIVWVGTENRQHLLGHMSLLGMKGEPAFPMCAAGPEESRLGDPAWVSMAEWADRCREREGVVVIPHFPNPYAEVVADIILGKVDAVEIREFFGPTLDSFGIREWYRFLNLGYRVAAVGGTDKMSAGMPLGGVRTYARLGDEAFSFANWGKAVRAGRTFTTSGPLIGLEVEGKTLGDEIRLPRGGGSLNVHAWAESTCPFDVLQVVVSGQVVAEGKAAEGGCEASLRASVRIDRSGWIASRCIGKAKAWHCWPVHIAAHTSPVYVKVGDDGGPFSPSDAAYMLTMLEGGLTWLETLAIPADPERQAAIQNIFGSAHRDLHRRLETHTRAGSHPR